VWLLFTRLSNADQALENLHFFENSYRTEEPCIASLEENVSRLPAVTGRVQDAQRDIEVVMVCDFSHVHILAAERRRKWRWQWISIDWHTWMQNNIKSHCSCTNRVVFSTNFIITKYALKMLCCRNCTMKEKIASLQWRPWIGMVESSSKKLRWVCVHFNYVLHWFLLFV